MPLGVLRPSGSPAAVLFAGAPVAGCCPGRVCSAEDVRTITRTIPRPMTSPTVRFSRRNIILNCNVGTSGTLAPTLAGASAIGAAG